MNMSHPSRMRGLKSFTCVPNPCQGTSYPSRMCGLKYDCRLQDVNYPPPKGSGLLLNGSPD